MNRLSLWAIVWLVVAACGEPSADTKSKPVSAAATTPAPKQKPTNNYKLAPPEKMQAGKKHCDVICERSRELKCGVSEDDCMIACASMLQTPVCHDELLSVMECVIKEPVASWECSEQKIAAIKEAFCVPEQE
ncbi:MAG: hypothetical protein JXR76_20220, partial [Deltaproteobacteria bacterium]|nr:hypothetical protein [Deltaproteobacteria bacterium]